MSSNLRGRSLAFIVVAALLIALFQPWSYNRRGFAEASIRVGSDEIRLSLYDQAGAKQGKPYCLFTTFRTADPPGQPVTISIERVGTRSAPDLKTHIVSSGETFGIDSSASSLSYFEAQGIPKLEFPSDEPLEVSGTVQYRGAVRPFQVSMKLQHWEKARKVTRFCV